MVLRRKWPVMLRCTLHLLFSPARFPSISSRPRLHDLTFEANATHFAVVTFVGAFFLTQSHSIAAKDKYNELKMARASSPLLAKSSGRSSTKNAGASNSAAAALESSTSTEAAAYALFTNNLVYAALYLFISLKLFPSFLGDWVSTSDAVLGNYATSVILPALIVWFSK